MRNKFDEQLEALHIELIKMGCLCETAIANASKSLQNANEDILNNIAEIENDIDQKERDIEGLCMKLLLQQQPVATDLRIVSAAMKMVSDMERIGDQASDIAEITKYINSNLVFEGIHLSDMASATVKMVTESITSFVKSDLERAQNASAHFSGSEYFNPIRPMPVSIFIWHLTLLCAAAASSFAYSRETTPCKILFCSSSAAYSGGV